MSPLSFVAHILKEELQQRKAKNPAYSLRAYARQVGISATALSQIVNGKRPVTARTARLLIDRTPLAPEKVRRIQAVLSLPRAEGREQHLRELHQLVRDFERAWNAHDPERLCGYWTEDGCLIDPWGKVLDGRPAILEFYRMAHSSFLRDARIQMGVHSIAFSGAASAFLDLRSTLFGVRTTAEAPPVDLELVLPATVLRRRGAWKVLACRPYSFLPPDSSPEELEGAVRR